MTVTIPSRTRMTSVAAIFVGIYCIYSGLGIASTGQALSLTGGDYGSIYEALGGLWKFFGLLYIFLGFLCFVIAAGLLMLKEWARRNGVPLFWAIAIMSLFFGAVLGSYSVLDGIVPFIFLGVSAGLALKLRSSYVRSAIEYHGQDMAVETGGAYYSDVRREIKEEKLAARAEKRAMKSGRGVEVRQANVHVREARSETTRSPKAKKKCQRCGTVNLGEREACKRCGAIL